MKKNLLLIAAVLIAVYQAIGQCNPYFMIKDGASWEMTSYNAKGKEQGKTKQEVLSYTDSGGGFEAKIKTIAMDMKGKEQMQAEYTVSCEGGVMMFDMDEMMSGSMKAFEDMNMKITGDNLEYPSGLSVGDELKPGKINMEMAGSSSMPMAMKFFIEIVDRKVLAKEEVTTPAGTFDCYKITSTVRTKTMGKMEVKSIEWIAEDRGVVKTESYTKNGKLSGYTLLTKVN